MSATADAPARWRQYLADCREAASVGLHPAVHGRLTRVTGLVMEAAGLRLPMGSTCTVVQDGGLSVEAEVVGFAGERLYLMPAADVYGLAPGATVVPSLFAPPRPRFGVRNHPWRRVEDRSRQVPIGAGLLGRVLDASGRPLDGRGPLHYEALRPLASRPTNPFQRRPITEALDVGVRAINALFSVGRGQRMGVFAGSGVGKSVLLGMMARYTTADVIVVGLIGERGREVKEFIEDILGPEGLARAVVIAAPADTPPLARLHGAAYAAAVAEAFRDAGRNVLLIMDSLTRFAMAQRELALAIGEPPATKGYPPSVFARLPQLVERSGNGAAEAGSITAFYTVLTEGDDPQDPIADAARAILDGHIVLSRHLADAGHYPAIDVEASISRVMPNVADPEQVELARRFRALYSTYQRNHDLVSVGAYMAGSNPDLDQAIALWPRLRAFLRQDMRERAGLEESLAALCQVLPDPARGSDSP